MSSSIADRLTRLRALFSELEIDALLVTSEASRRYLSGFTGSAGRLLITADAAYMQSSPVYYLQAEQEAPLYTLLRSEGGYSEPGRLVETIAAAGVRRIGIEAQAMTVNFYKKLRQELRQLEGKKRKLVALENPVMALRIAKDAEELTLLRRAIAITDAAFAQVTAQLRPDHTERQAAWMIDNAMRELGAEKEAFETIVAAGARSAMPHAHPTDEPLGSGRPIIIDMGAMVDGYRADMTRAIVLGEPDERFQYVYTAVLAGQQQAIKAMRSGIISTAIDTLTREAIQATGIAPEYIFEHGMGHSVGLEIHEPPIVGRNKPQPLVAGSVMSVEPGVYIPDWGGVRIEDLVLVHEDRAEVLTATPYFGTDRPG